MGCDGYREGESSIALGHSKRKSVSQRFSVLKWGLQSVRVSAEERNCLEGVYTVRSEKGEESGNQNDC